MSLAAAELMARAVALEDSEDATRDRILDAALREAAAVGVARMTTADVVRRSGLGRMTVYRRFERRDQLVDALAVRETRRFLDAVAVGMADATDADQATADGFVAGIAFVRSHPLLRRAAEDDPGAIFRSAAEHDGAILALGTGFIAARLHAGQTGRPTRRERWVADVLARLFLAYVAIPPTDPAAQDDKQLRAFAQAVLAPIVASAHEV